MIRAPSLQRPYDLFVTCDPAVIQPPKLEGEPTDEFRAEVEQYVQKIKTARETGDWSAVLRPDQVPTKFTLGQIDRNVWRAIIDRGTLPADNPRHIGHAVVRALLFRLAIRSISGFDKFDRLPDPAWDNWVMAPASLVTQLDEVDASIIGELGNEIMRRLQGVDPLS